MVGDELATITAELIEAARSERGGWSKAQLALLGVSWPPQAGWKATVIGRPISKGDADRFVKLRGGGSASGPSLF